jgi:hypothetical protein
MADVSLKLVSMSTLEERSALAQQPKDCQLYEMLAAPERRGAT